MIRLFVSSKDKEDDISIGVKSTALLFQDKTVPWLALFSSIMVANLTAAGYMADQTWPYFAAVTGVSAQLIWQVNISLYSNPSLKVEKLIHDPSCRLQIKVVPKPIKESGLVYIF